MITKDLKTASRETLGILLEYEVEVRKMEMIKEYDYLLYNPNLSLGDLEQAVARYQNAVDCYMKCVNQNNPK